ncbi:hypothetical protein [Vibrio spartinae]|uniref:DUF1240 domain-containing protein n=1 Tax=Vibrio spartinae TaxID=1918945 RepID=A0ABX6QVE5_9VIBR|nr:hypothetical protein [Vibrio spartinae]QMV13199.1 hypothetical protein Vspart_00408 [Vibrio spartinae]
MKEETTTSQILIGLLISGSLALFSLIYFTFSLFNLVEHFIHPSTVIEYNRGAMYGIGGIGLLSFFCGFLVLLFYRKLSPKAESRMGKGIIIGIILMFIFPLVSNFTVPSLIENSGYQRCEKAERRASWPIFRIHIYTDNRQVCEQLIEEKQQTGRY